MFEKEAEELFSKKPLGYEMKPELEIYKDGFKDGYNKATEWHYVKDKLPEEDVYVYLWCKGDGYPVVARRHIFYGETEWKWNCKWGSGYQLKADSEKVIAWKEIVLPELKDGK